MGPLIPQDIISGDLNFFFALILGIAFGFILEQAGFSSSRKLAGVFYGYDFVVLKVFFTAGVTAAIGLFFMKYMGWVDFAFLYVNPLYVWSALIGGVVMGFGFILGGFCPGTSLAAAVIGKIDAWFFIAGMFIGVVLFGVFYPFFEPLHTGSYLGTPFVYETLGMSQKWFLFFLIIMALSAFAVTQMIEDNSTKFKELLNNQKLSLRYPLTFILLLSIIIVFLPEKRRAFVYEENSNSMVSQIVSGDRYVTYEKVAHSLINSVNDLYLVDVRTSEEFNQYHLPGAINVPLVGLLNKNSLSTETDKKIVLYGNGSTQADMAWFFLTREGFEKIFVLKEGLNGFYDNIFADLPAQTDTTVQGVYDARFIEHARTYFKEGHATKAVSNASIPVPDATTPKAVKGGC